MGIFKTLFDLRLKAHNRPLEDYLTEIISYILRNNLELLNDFLIHFKIVETPVESFNITSQLTLKKLKKHQSDSRPDMVIFLEDRVIFFENKINSSEGFNQLKRYAEHLDHLTDGKKTLVYLTKHYDLKNPEKIFSDCSNDITFIQVRWHKVYRFFENYKDDPLVFELLLFMKQIHLSMHNQFNPSDIITLTNFTNVRKMMDETMFGKVSNQFSHINSGRSKRSTCTTELGKYDRYIYYRTHQDGLWCGLGYWMNSTNEKEYPDVGIILEINPNSSKRKEIINTFNLVIQEYKSWKGYNLSNPKAWSGITYSSSLQSFLSENSQTEKIKDFFIEGLKQMEEIFSKYENLPIIKPQST